MSGIVTALPCAAPTASRPRRQPRGDLRPAVHRGAARVDERLDAAGGRDVVLPGPHRQDGTGDALEIHPLAAHDELALDETVRLVELLHPLAEELAREGDVLVGPLVERVEPRHVLGVPEVPPEIEARAQIHRWLEKLEAGLDHVGWDA